MNSSELKARYRLTQVFAVCTGFALLYAPLTVGLEPPNADAQKELHERGKRGDPEAQVNLAILYWYNGHPGDRRKPPNAREFKECAKWARLAADQGNTAALQLLGRLSDEGLGVEKDEAKAFQFYLEAAKHGNCVAQADLGRKYATGSGVTKSLIESYAWYSLAEEDPNMRLVVREKLQQLEAEILQEAKAEAASRKRDLEAMIRRHTSTAGGKPDPTGKPREPSHDDCEWRASKAGPSQF